MTNQILERPIVAGTRLALGGRSSTFTSMRPESLPTADINYPLHSRSHRIDASLVTLDGAVAALRQSSERSHATNVDCRKDSITFTIESGSLADCSLGPPTPIAQRRRRTLQ